MNLGLIHFVTARLVALVLLALGTLALPLASAQTGRTHRVGFVSVASESAMASRVDAFRGGLRDLGYVEGKNLSIEFRWADGDNERLSSLVGELIGQKIDLLVAHGVAATAAARKATATTPIICFACGDLAATGLVASMARPGGNVTGQTIIAPDLTGKRLALLKEVVPGLTRVAVLWNPDNPVSVPEFSEAQAAARALGLQLLPFGARGSEGLDDAFAAMGRQGAGALLVFSDANLFGQRKRIADLAAMGRLPAISWTGEFARSGGLMGYGPDLLAMSRHSATFVDRILKGAKPADLPVEQPTKFEFVINLRAARALGLTIPRTTLLRADVVIE